MLAAFEEAHAAAAPVYDMADIAADPHYRERGSIVEVDGIPMQGLVARLSATPGRIRWTGRRPSMRDGAEIRTEVEGAEQVWAPFLPGAEGGEESDLDAVLGPVVGGDERGVGLCHQLAVSSPWVG